MVKDMKSYLIALLFAMLGALAAVFFIWLFSIMSWVLLWAVLVFIFIPVASSALRLWVEEDCYDFDDFLKVLFKDRKKSNSISNDDELY